jgi:hypothetical protein
MTPVTAWAKELRGIKTIKTRLAIHLLEFI